MHLSSLHLSTLTSSFEVHSPSAALKPSSLPNCEVRSQSQGLKFAFKCARMSSRQAFFRACTKQFMSPVDKRSILFHKYPTKESAGTSRGATRPAGYCRRLCISIFIYALCATVCPVCVRFQRHILKQYVSENRTQIGHKPDTNRTQTGHKPDTNRIQTGHKLDTNWI